MYAFSLTPLHDPVIRICPRHGLFPTANCSAVIFSLSMLSVSQPFRPSVDNTNTVADPSYSLNKKFRAASAKVPRSKGGRKSVDGDGTVEQYVWRMDMASMRDKPLT